MICELGKCWGMWIWYLCILFQHLCSTAEWEHKQHGEVMNWKTVGLRLVKD